MLGWPQPSTAARAFNEHLGALFQIKREGKKSMGLLSDKVAVITGGISGLGRASALRYAAEGARVVVADINAERGANAAANVCERCLHRVIQVDVTSEESQRALFADVVSRYGQVDTVLAAAGVSSSGYISGEVSEVEAEPEERMFHNRDA